MMLLGKRTFQGEGRVEAKAGADLLHRGTGRARGESLNRPLTKYMDADTIARMLTIMVLMPELHSLLLLKAFK